MHDRPTTLAGLRAAGWVSRSVAEEVRANAAALIRSGGQLFDGIVGYDDTVVPQMQNALLAGHDIILLGERGQAKTRIARSLTGLLDEWMPMVAGSEINDDPFHPVSRFARDLVGSEGEDTPIDWVHRDQRCGEKLATPDTSIADLIGEVDPIRVAEGRYLSDESTLHYGLVPRTNRGIFIIDELPDLAERIQVGLLNVLEERDVQIRGYKVRLPLDVMLLATANPEDYTSRGRMITPLKDRFGAQIRTHYPTDLDTEMRIVSDQARLVHLEGIEVAVPEHMAEIVAELSQAARRDAHVSSYSGVSVRLTISNLETLVANATRRALILGETSAVPRVSDLGALVASTMGKVEIESFGEGRDHQIIEGLVRGAVRASFERRFAPGDLDGVVEAFGPLVHVDAGEMLGCDRYGELLVDMPALRAPVFALVGEDARPSEIASGVEFILEGLHLTGRIDRHPVEDSARYPSSRYLGS